MGDTGTDTASYAGATAGVVASLANASINTGDATGDSYDQIENLTGTSHNDYVYGNNGDNIITAGAGNDAFVFNTVLNATTNIDVIQDFDVPHDSIWLDNSVFTSLKDGALAAGAFRLAGAAPDSAVSYTIRLRASSATT